MCTCSILPPPASAPDDPVLIAFNRDELRRRPAEHPPGYLCYGQRLAVHPSDALGGGTWIGINDAGLVAALLNVNPTVRAIGTGLAASADPLPAPPPLAPGARRASRGALVPYVLACSTFAEVRADLAGIPDGDFQPYTLLVLDRTTLIVRRWDGTASTQQELAVGAGPWLFTSSGLGDVLVEPPRRQLFGELVVPTAPLVERRRQQAAFHRHTWPDRPELSVCMRRADACTVSHATVELGVESLTLGYTPGPPDTQAPVAHYALAWATPDRP